MSVLYDFKAPIRYVDRNNDNKKNHFGHFCFVSYNQPTHILQIVPSKQHTHTHLAAPPHKQPLRWKLNFEVRTYPSGPVLSSFLLNLSLNEPEQTTIHNQPKLTQYKWIVLFYSFVILFLSIWQLQQRTGGCFLSTGTGYDLHQQFCVQPNNTNKHQNCTEATPLSLFPLA